ncbi:ATP-binding cassette domain-containing protein [Phototrophicus methaneseepsis]|uniref:ATP-binding cassette domain-containing protein n=1 Tax=Phototrophicus methaneseepsis TaxID=2710758 RepID=A0A7S8EBT2_9CHLR|nr:ATP-binding cassette domain-containing protein [Phototrophicus methaneseepsis]QPC83959.1 ATP-binding cassette domain-containing protein [Phototrophicus methaneseepsis]
MNIELLHIHKRFGPVHANNDITVTFNEGRIIGVLGENGAGKSTLMKILSGYQPATSGEIRIDGKPVSTNGPLAAIGSGIGMLQQDPLDVGAFTVLENFSYGQPGGLFFRKSRDYFKKQLAEYSQRFGFDLPPEMPIDALSIAQRQQLEMVRLLALGVRTLILDEPTTGISAEQKDALFNALRELAHDDGMIVLLVSHKLEDVIALCDEVIVLRAGELVGAKEMPATTQELVALMFGGELPKPERAPAPIGDVVFSLRDVHLRDTRLDMPNLNLSVRAGEVIGLAGLDGSGQTLFMRACAGLEPTHGGRILLNGADMTGKHYRDYLTRQVVFGAAGRIEEGLVAGLTLTEHMALVMDHKPIIQWPAARQRMTQQIDHYAIRGRPGDHIEQLSGGNQQRVLMALLPDAPQLLVLEQPTRGLDVESANWIWQQLLARRESGTAIIFSSAELEELVTYSDRILVFYAGRVHEVTNVADTNIDELGHMIGGEFNHA